MDIVKPRISDDVDRADQLQLYHYIRRQSRKWYKYLFWYVFNVAACNAYNLKCKATGKKQPQDEFCLELGKALISNFNSKKRSSLDNPQSFLQPFGSHKRLLRQKTNESAGTARRKARKLHRGLVSETTMFVYTAMTFPCVKGNASHYGMPSLLRKVFV